MCHACHTKRVTRLFETSTMTPSAAIANGPAIYGLDYLDCERLRMDADGCGRLRTVAHGCGQFRAAKLLERTHLDPQPPKVKQT